MPCATRERRCTTFPRDLALSNLHSQLGVLTSTFSAQMCGRIDLHSCTHGPTTARTCTGYCAHVWAIEIGRQSNMREQELHAGVGFTATSLMQGGALVHVYMDGTVLVTHGGVELGQGIHTKCAMVRFAQLLTHRRFWRGSTFPGSPCCWGRGRLLRKQLAWDSDLSSQCMGSLIL